MKPLIIALLSLLYLSAYSNTPTCHEHSGGNYCQYKGKVHRVYVNSGNMILLYFENAISISEPESYGFSVSNGNAASININDNVEFAQFFYSTAMAAQLSGREVTIQMRGSRHGYLKADRIWLR